MISLVFSHVDATGRRHLFESRIVLTGAKVKPEFYDDFALIATDSNFTAPTTERQRHLGTLFNPAWVGECLQEYHVGSITIAPIEAGTPVVQLNQNEPAATPDGKPIPGFRQAAAMFLDWYAAPRQRLDSRDLTFTALGYVAARRAAAMDLSGQAALDAVENAMTALSTRLELDEPMPLGYLDPLLANGALGFAGLLSGKPRWMATDRFTTNLPTLTAAAAPIDETFLQRCSEIDPGTLRPKDDEVSAHEALQGEAFLAELAPFMTDELIDALRMLGYELAKTFPQDAE